MRRAAVVVVDKRRASSRPRGEADYDGCVVWLVTAMQVVHSPETGHKAIIGRQAECR